MLAHVTQAPQSAELTAQPAMRGVPLGVFPSRESALKYAQDFASSVGMPSDLALVFAIRPYYNKHVLTYRGSI